MLRRAVRTEGRQAAPAAGGTRGAGSASSLQALAAHSGGSLSVESVRSELDDNLESLAQLLENHEQSKLEEQCSETLLLLRSRTLKKLSLLRTLLSRGAFSASFSSALSRSRGVRSALQLGSERWLSGLFNIVRCSVAALDGSVLCYWRSFDASAALLPLHSVAESAKKGDGYVSGALFASDFLDALHCTGRQVAQFWARDDSESGLLDLQLVGLEDALQELTASLNEQMLPHFMAGGERSQGTCPSLELRSAFYVSEHARPGAEQDMMEEADVAIVTQLSGQEEGEEEELGDQDESEEDMVRCKVGHSVACYTESALCDIELRSGGRFVMCFGVTHRFERFMELPEKVQHHVLSFLGARDLLNASTASKAMHELCTHDTPWQHVLEQWKAAAVHEQSASKRGKGLMEDLKRLKEQQEAKYAENKTAYPLWHQARDVLQYLRERSYENIARRGELLLTTDRIYETPSGECSEEDSSEKEWTEPTETEAEFMKRFRQYNRRPSGSHFDSVPLVERWKLEHGSRMVQRDSALFAIKSTLKQQKGTQCKVQ